MRAARFLLISSLSLFACSTHSGSSSSPSAGGNGSSGGTHDGGPVDCDPRRILCKRVAPSCPQGQVPSVSGNCYGDCVPAESCACDEAADCPDADHFTCHMSAGHCGPYV